MSFSALGLSAPLQKAVSEQGYDTPSPIQVQAIPAVLTGKDVMAAAQTGTGKPQVLRCHYWNYSLKAKKPSQDKLAP